MIDQIPSFGSEEGFLRNFKLKFDWGKAAWTTWETINDEREAARGTLKEILETRQHMDDLGLNNTPLLIWQIDRLGRMYPKMTNLIRRALGLKKEFIIDDALILRKPKKRVIFIMTVVFPAALLKTGEVP